jgi:hypothetical protein
MRPADLSTYIISLQGTEALLNCSNLELRQQEALMLHELVGHISRAIGINNKNIIAEVIKTNSWSASTQT